MRSPQGYEDDAADRRAIEAGWKRYENREPREMSPVEVWCSRCIEPATVALRLTLGEVRSYCDTHAWALRAPGSHRHAPGQAECSVCGWLAEERGAR